MERTEKITIRISREDLDSIDEFLERNHRYGSRSEFFRKLASDFVSNSNRHLVHLSDTVCIKIPRSINNLLSAAVEKGIFNSVSESISIILNDLDSNRELLALIKKRFEIEKEKREILREFSEGNELIGDGRIERRRNL